jgi:hypothetical protein
LPELLTVVVVLAEPAKVTVAPLPPAAGLIVPETEYVAEGGGCVELFPLTRPEHPAIKARDEAIAIDNGTLFQEISLSFRTRNNSVARRFIARLLHQPDLGYVLRLCGDTGRKFKSSTGVSPVLGSPKFMYFFFILTRDCLQFDKSLWRSSAQKS